MVQPIVCIHTMVFDHISAVPNCPLVFRKPTIDDIMKFNQCIIDMTDGTNSKRDFKIATAFEPLDGIPFRWTLRSDRGYNMEFHIVNDDTNTLKVIVHEPFQNEFSYRMFYDDMVYSLWYALLGFGTETPKNDEWGLDLEHLLFEK